MYLLAILAWLAFAGPPHTDVSASPQPALPLTGIAAKVEALISAPGKLRSAESYLKRAGHHPCDGFEIFMDLQSLPGGALSPYVNELTKKVSWRLGQALVATKMKSKCLGGDKDEWSMRMILVASPLVYAKLQNGQFPAGTSYEKELQKVWKAWGLAGGQKPTLSASPEKAPEKAKEGAAEETKKPKKEAKKEEKKEKPVDPFSKLSKEEAKILAAFRKDLALAQAYLAKPEICAAHPAALALMDARSTHRWLLVIVEKRKLMSEAEYVQAIGVTGQDLLQLSIDVGDAAGKFYIEALHSPEKMQTCVDRPFTARELARIWAGGTGTLRQEQYIDRFTEDTTAPPNFEHISLRLWGATQEDIEEVYRLPPKSH